MDQKQKIRKWCTIIILAAVFSVFLISSSWKNFRKGVYIGDQFFYKISDTLYRNGSSDDIKLQNSGDETEFALLLDGKPQTVQMQWSGDSVEILYEDGTVINGRWDGRHICDEDGAPVVYNWNELAQIRGGEYARNEKGTVSIALCKISQEETEMRGSIWGTIAGVIIYLIGSLTVLFPNEVYFFLSRWAYKEPELSAAGMFVQRLCGVVIMIVGIVIMYIGVGRL